jgi:hypothetical protein
MYREGERGYTWSKTCKLHDLDAFQRRWASHDGWILILYDEIHRLDKR